MNLSAPDSQPAGVAPSQSIPQRSERPSSELLFERLLWGTRNLMIVPVVASLAMAVGALVMATIDVAIVARELIQGHYGDSKAAEHTHTAVLTTLVRSLDGYLLAAILIIFALGLYELFISKIDIAEHSEVAKRVLLIRSLDDLKDRLGKVVVLILVITFFQRAAETEYTRPLDLLWLALGTLLVGGALHLSGRHPSAPSGHLP